MDTVSRTTKISKIWSRLRNKAYRDAYASGFIGNSIASQIFAIRRDRSWTQSDLAEKIGMKQARISVLENSCENVSLNTLKRIASAFDVALLVKFISHREMVLEIADSMVDRNVPDFEHDLSPMSRTAPVVFAPVTTSSIEFKVISQVPGGASAVATMQSTRQWASADA